MKLCRLLACLSLLASRAEAGPIHHVVATGESLSSVAHDYYGDSRLAPVLAVENELGADPPVPGQRLSIPSASAHEVGPGETWSSLARDHWDDAKLGRHLAVFLDLDGSVPPRAGAVLPIPALLTWKVQRGKTLSSLSRTFYGSANRASAIARLNGIRDPRRMQAGAKLRIPFPEIAQQPSPPAEVSAQTDASMPTEVSAQADVSAPPRRESDKLRRAVNAYLDGSFEESLQLLEALRTPVLAQGSDAEREQLFTHLVFAYVAFARNADACSAYRALRGVNPAVRFDADLTSPKVLSAISTCE